MRVLHVIPSLSPVHGGPSIALPLMARSLVQLGVEVDVATTDDDGPGGKIGEAVPGRRMQRDGFGVYFFPRQSEFYKVSFPFSGWLAKNAQRYDLLHIHALFSFLSTSAARIARRRHVPYIVRPLGVLNEWGIQNRRPVLKALSFRLVEAPILQHAGAIHYTSESELKEAERAGAPAGKGKVIPLGIETDRYASLPGTDFFYERCPQARGRSVVLFLSRIDPKKGLDLLLPAFAAVRKKHPDALLVVAGRGDAGYVHSLQDEASELGIEEAVLWPGHLDKEDKLSALAAATIYVLPSYSENFGIALVEALAAGLPCVTTTGVAVAEEIRAADAGAIVQPDVHSLACAFDRLLTDADLRRQYRERAQQLARDCFSATAMGRNLHSLYQQIVT
jgi:glycosyltransferase involved in cell wall biosynthesis